MNILFSIDRGIATFRDCDYVYEAEISVASAIARAYPNVTADVMHPFGEPDDETSEQIGLNPETFEDLHAILRSKLEKQRLAYESQIAILKASK